MLKRTLASALFIVLLVGYPPIVVSGENTVTINTRQIEAGKEQNIIQISDASFQGEQEGSNSGKSSSMNGDINGDGYDDLVIGSPYFDGSNNYCGKVYIIFGGQYQKGNEVNFSKADASIIGSTNHGGLGSCVDIIRDINGDGYDDLVLGESGNSEYESKAGIIHIFFGGENSFSKNASISSSDVKIICRDDYSYLGDYLSSAGDVNGDGLGDLLFRKGRSNDEIYLLFGHSDEWNSTIELDDIDIKILKEENGPSFSFSTEIIGSLGDLNLDGMDEFYISAGSSYGGKLGKVYVFFGRDEGWKNEINLAEADFCFLEEEGISGSDNIGYDVESGDLNGDGLKDIVVGAPYFSIGDSYNWHGKVYIMFGNDSLWKGNISLADSNASFYGQQKSVRAGTSVEIPGDMNGDGFDDLIISQIKYENNSEDVGKVDIILGKDANWRNEVNLSESDISIIGTPSRADLGRFISSGDINGDLSPDICISAGSGFDRGWIYVVEGISNCEPDEVHSINLFKDDGYSIGSTKFDVGDTVYIKLIGLDSNNSVRNVAKVNLSSSCDKKLNLLIPLRETGNDSGIFQGKFKISPRFNYFEIITITSWKDSLKKCEYMVISPNRPASIVSINLFSSSDHIFRSEKFFRGDLVYIELTGQDSDPCNHNYAFINCSSEFNSSYHQMNILKETTEDSGVFRGIYVVPNELEFFDNITLYSSLNEYLYTQFQMHIPVLIKPSTDITSAYEDKVYIANYSNFGYSSSNWTVDTIAPWLEWDKQEEFLWGIPTNRHVGNWDVYIKLEDGLGNMDEHSFTIEVINIPPDITTENINVTYEGREYVVDYNCSDDFQGNIEWSLLVNIPWLEIEQDTGILKGTPINEDVGSWNISILVSDSNGGTNSTSFILDVLNINENPEIITTDLKTATQGERYYRDYDAKDPDINDEMRWTLSTNSTFLSIDPITGILEGIPGKHDVGSHMVNVTVVDKIGLTDSHRFELIVENVNDKPEFLNVPVDSEVLNGRYFVFDVNATDPDAEDTIEYSVQTIPDSDMKIEPETGIISWKASTKWFEESPYRMKVRIRVSDFELDVIHSFDITILTTEPPTSTLLTPLNGNRTASVNTILYWEGFDPEHELLYYDLYIHENKVYVESLREEAQYLMGLKNTEFQITDLKFGSIYFWTVIPFDGGSYGICESNVFSFIINNPPSIMSIPDQKIETGSEFKIRIEVADDDTEDQISFRFSLIDPPEGMTISENGIIKWKPDSGQHGDYVIKVKVSDGVESDIKAFYLVVDQSNEGSLNKIILTMIIVSIIIILCIILIFVLIRKTNNVDREIDVEIGIEDNENLDDSSGKNTLSDVPLTTSEAHAHLGKGSKNVSYEDLYGVPAPENETDQLSTSELKEYIQQTIAKLEE